MHDRRELGAAAPLPLRRGHRSRADRGTAHGAALHYRDVSLPWTPGRPQVTIMSRYASSPRGGVGTGTFCPCLDSGEAGTECTCLGGGEPGTNVPVSGGDC